MKDKLEKNEEKKVIPATFTIRGADFVGTPSPSGSKYHWSQDYLIDKETGLKYAVKGERIDMDLFIQSSKDSCDILTIYEKALAGDTSVLNVSKGIYADVAAMPKNVFEMDNLSAKVRAEYEALPDVVKAAFGNKFDTYYASALDGSLIGKVQNVLTKLVNEKKEGQE